MKQNIGKNLGNQYCWAIIEYAFKLLIRSEV